MDSSIKAYTPSDMVNMVEMGNVAVINDPYAEVSGICEMMVGFAAKPEFTKFNPRTYAKTGDRTG
jgi:hypothetical protein